MPKKRYLIAWIAGLAALAGLLVFAFLTYDVLRPEAVTRQENGDEQIKQLCTAPKKQDHQWRWYTRNYPSPDLQWRIFVVGNTLCFGSDENWKGFAIDRGEVKEYGCFETHAGLFCRRNADPTKHPNAQEHLS